LQCVAACSSVMQFVAVVTVEFRGEVLDS